MSTDDYYLEISSYEHQGSANPSQTLRLLNTVILYLPMWCSKPPNQSEERNKYLSIIIILIVIGFTLFHLVFAYIIIFDVFFFDVVFAIIYITLEVGLTFARLLTLYYFYVHFNFPWLTNFNPLNDNISCYNYLIKILMFLLFIIDGVSITGAIIKNISLHNMHIIAYLELTALITGRIFIFWPLFVTLAVHSMICLKYYLALIEVHRMLNHENINVDLSQLFLKYQKLYDAYKIDYHPILNWSLHFILCSYAFNIWIDTYSIFYADSFDWPDIFDAACIVIIFIIYCVFSSLMNEKFEQFERSLSRFGITVIQNDVKHFFNNNYYNYLLHFVSRYPISIRIGILTVTRSNAIKFLIGFVGLKLISYAIQYYTVMQ
eukprot:246389_1